MTIYITDQAGVLNGPVELPVIPGVGAQVPSNAIELPALLAEPDAGYVWAMVEGRPQQLPDNRGTVYSTTTGEATQYEQLGALPAGLTVEPRPSADHRWNGQAWIFDAELAATNREVLAGNLGARIDSAADAARSAVVGDAVRSLEYQKAADEAQAFADAGYPADAVPRTVAAYVTAERTAQQAADSILAEAAAYNEALYTLRETRLQAKERVRKAMDSGDIELAQAITDETVAAIQAAVAGVGNAGA